MAGGNQRDIDRARAEKRKGALTQHDKDGLTVAQRKERCVAETANSETFRRICV